MNWKNSVLVMLFFIKMLIPILNSAEEIINQEEVDQRAKNLNAYDPISHTILPTLHFCKQSMQPINRILFDSVETKIINNTEVQTVMHGFLPFYTNFCCTGVRVSIEILAHTLYKVRDCRRYNCLESDRFHQERVKKLSDRTHLFLIKAQDFIETEITRRQKLTTQWIEFSLDGAILFLESVCNET